MGAGYAMRVGMFFVIRTQSKPLGMVPSVRQLVGELDQAHPVANVRTVEDLLDQQVRYVRL